MEAQSESFNSTVIAALEEKKNWYDTTQLPKIQDNYRLHLVCVNNIIEALSRKSLVNPDPYKKDKKVTSVSSIDDSPFNDNERATQLGIRLSDYQNMLDFVCNYMKFTIEQLTPDKVKKLIDLNATFGWTNLTPNSPKINTRSLANCIIEARNGAQALQAAMINDSIGKTKEALEFINAALKELLDFQRELYKGDVRRLVMDSSDFNKAAFTDAAALIAEIKRLFPSKMPKRTFSNDLIAEIAEEETAPSKDQLRQRVLAKLKTVTTVKNEQKKNTVTTHEILVEAVRILATSSEQYAVVLEKISTNSAVLRDGANSFKDKFARFWRRVFGLPEPEIEYNIVLTDQTTKQTHREKINYTEFFASLNKRTKYYATVANRQSTGYNRVDAQSDEKILEFLNKQLAENARLMQVLTALDDYFKSSAPTLERSKIKGIKPELSFLKSILVKTNQYKAEYLALAEEKEQMRKLGITE
ncbi:MAG TPA: hypothetical protein DEO40_01910 [Treponema sp.]|jgi:hypothetical protein|nr:hypothetical protein [Treponema sp.]HBB42594.1 hypothetical protein [Treponema sp.]HCA19416.1 hypothetical protein [Treponema sp.]